MKKFLFFKNTMALHGKSFIRYLNYGLLIQFFKVLGNAIALLAKATIDIYIKYTAHVIINSFLSFHNLSGQSPREICIN